MAEWDVASRVATGTSGLLSVAPEPDGYPQPLSPQRPSQGLNPWVTEYLLLGEAMGVTQHPEERSPQPQTGHAGQ